MKIGLLGMSGVGKTFWATRLTALGFVCFHCDDLITAQLRVEVAEPLAGVDDMGRWMGFPDEAGFAEKENRYLELESQTLVNLTHTLARWPHETNNVVVDLTGSAIYTEAAVLTHLRQCVTFVYLALTPAVHAAMCQEYLRRPRPLLWRGRFTQAPGETRAVALAHSYTRLIADREQRYEKFCDIKIEYNIHRQAGFTAEALVQMLRAAKK